MSSPGVKISTCLISLVFMTMLFISPAQGCFGPKLFFGAGKTAEEQVLYALISLYVQEKTGVESTLVEIAAGERPSTLVDNDKADLVLISTVEPTDRVVFSVTGFPALASGQRPHEDLQFTTVLPAIRKLNGLLTVADLDSLVSRVEDGESPLSVVRKFFMERRWI